MLTVAHVSLSQNRGSPQMVGGSFSDSFESQPEANTQDWPGEDGHHKWQSLKNEQISRKLMAILSQTI